MLGFVTQALAIAKNAFVESLRQPIFLVMVLVAGILQLFNTWTSAFAMGYSTSAEVHGDNKMLFDVGMGSVFVCGVLLAAFIATAVVSREIENKTVLTVVSKPVNRATVVVGKYIGVAASLLIALAIMLIALLMGLRHGVMSMAGDALDGPVWTFTIAALVLSFGLAGWCNFFYGWSFPQTAILLLFPLSLVAYVLVLLLSKKWEWQPIHTDFKPQVTLACLALALAILVLAAVATAVSTRLGQVMTIVACAGVFLAGLLSNYLVGRHVFTNQSIALIREVVPDHPTETGWPTPGFANRITFATPPIPAPKVGDAFFYGPSPSGYPMSVAGNATFTGDVNNPQDLLGRATPPALVVTGINADGVTVRRAGEAPLDYDRPPQKDDYAFLAPTKANAPALALWSIVPNMQAFWLLDAVTENQRIPPSHILMLLFYGVLQIAAFLAIGAALFQNRDVG